MKALTNKRREIKFARHESLLRTLGIGMSSWFSKLSEVEAVVEAREAVVDIPFSLEVSLQE